MMQLEPVVRCQATTGRANNAIYYMYFVVT